MTFYRNGREIGSEDEEEFPGPDPVVVRQKRMRNKRNAQTIKRMLANPGNNLMNGRSQHRRIRR